MPRSRVESGAPRRTTATHPYYGQRLSNTSDPGVSMRITYVCCDQAVEIPLPRPDSIPDSKDALTRKRVRFVRGELESEEDDLVSTSLQNDYPLPSPVPSVQTARQSSYPFEIVRLCFKLILHIICGLIFTILSYAISWLISNVAIPMVGLEMPLELTLLASLFVAYYHEPAIIWSLFLTHVSLRLVYGLLWVFSMVGWLLEMMVD